MSFQTQEENFTTVSIGGTDYTISRFAPTPALKLSTRLAKFAGPAIAEAVESLKTATPGKKLTGADLNMGKIVLAIIPNIDEDLVSNTVKDLISCVAHKNVELKNQAYEDHFRGSNMKNLFPLVGKVVEYQFSDFLSGLLTGNRS